MKSQSVRLLDVFLIGPFMLYAAKKGRMTNGERLFMALLGVATIAYNARNYYLVEQEKGQIDAAA